MKCLTLSDLKTMVGSHEPCLSIYIPLAGSRDRDRETIENQLASAIVQARTMFPYIASVFTDVDVGKLMADLCINKTKSNASIQPWKCVAYFKSPSIEGYYPLAEISEDLCVVANSYHLKPLFGLIQVKPNYALIRLEDAAVTLHTGSIAGMYHSKIFERKTDDTLWPSSEGVSAVKRRLLSMERRRAEKSGGARFYRQAASSIRRHVNLDEVPAILMGPAKMIKAFIAANRFKASFIRTINTDKFFVVNELDYLHQLALESLAGHDVSRALKGIFEFKHLRRFGSAIDTLGQVAKAAEEGIIKSLLIRRGVNIWSDTSPSSPVIQFGQKEPPSAADDVLDDIGELVLATGGEVHLVNARDMPTQSPVAAVLAAS
jgi:hypothetical protein